MTTRTTALGKLQCSPQPECTEGSLNQEQKASTSSDQIKIKVNLSTAYKTRHEWWSILTLFNSIPNGVPIDEDRVLGSEFFHANKINR